MVPFDQFVGIPNVGFGIGQWLGIGGFYGFRWSGCAFIFWLQEEVPVYYHHFVHGFYDQLSGIAPFDEGTGQFSGLRFKGFQIR